MDFVALSNFIDIYQNLSLKKVAELRRVAPSTISRDLAKLEDSLGVRLFERSTRRVVATEEGHRLYRRMEPLISEFEQAKSSFADEVGGGLKGTIRVTTPVSFGLVHFVNVLDKFHSLYPAVDVEVLLSDSRIDLISERIDIAIRFGKLPDSGLMAKKLLALNYHVCVSPRYFNTHPAINSPDDLQQHSCLQFLLPNLDSHWKFKKKRSAKVQKVLIGSRLRFSNAIAIKQAALKGLGVALLPQVLIQEELSTKRLISVLPDYLTTPTDFDSHMWLLYPSNSYLPLRSREFIDFMVGQFAEQP